MASGHFKLIIMLFSRHWIIDQTFSPTDVSSRESDKFQHIDISIEQYAILDEGKFGVSTSDRVKDVLVFQIGAKINSWVFTFFLTGLNKIKLNC